MEEVGRMKILERSRYSTALILNWNCMKTTVKDSGVPTF
jgi:hypothetical protein